VLLLSRRMGEAIRITVPPGQETRVIRIKAVSHGLLRGVSLGLEADKDIQIDREEIALLKEADAREEGGPR